MKQKREKYKCKFCPAMIAPQGRVGHERAAHPRELLALTVVKKHRRNKAITTSQSLNAIQADQDYVLVPIKKIDILEAIKRLLV